jgi:tRNA (guanine37-N1)-methyltransferase
MWFGIVSLFPEMFSAIRDQGVVGRACDEGLIKLDFWNPRDFTHDRHRTVDDRPYGGGPGMLMKVEPLQAAITAAKDHAKTRIDPVDPVDPVGAVGDAGLKTIYLSPQGKRLTQHGLVELSACSKLILIAGRYEGIDERVIEAEVDEEISIGDFVLSGGELPAMVLIDALARWVPGVLGHDASAMEDSFVNGLLDCPHYTRPEVVAEKKVPDVLLSGNHQEIAKWRMQQSLGRTYVRRPDLLKHVTLTAAQRNLLEEYLNERGIEFRY